MKEILEEIETPYVDTATLLAKLPNYTNPRDWIARQVKAGRLARIKNGLFVISGRQVSLPQLANILYGPSYVSLQWALAYYGLIPERAFTVTSVTTRRNKAFQSPIATFTYNFLNIDRYCLSFTQLANEEKEHFLIATPEKALVDFVHFYCERDGILEQLCESHRMSTEDLRNLNADLIDGIALNYRSSKILHLSQILRNL